VASMTGPIYIRLEKMLRTSRRWPWLRQHSLAPRGPSHGGEGYLFQLFLVYGQQKLR
jgi:hypothetical protein